MPNVEVVTLSVNEVISLKDFAYCPKLKELYVRRNSIADLEEIQFLKNLPCLRVLWLSDNPCADSEDYRSTILKNLPNIQKLDNIEVNSDEVHEAVTSGREYAVPDDIPVYMDEAHDSSGEVRDDKILGLSTNGNTDIDESQHIESSANDLLDETNKLRTELGLKPLVIDDATADDIGLSEKVPVPCNETGLRTNTKNSNLLSAVLLLLNDMDEDDLRVVQKEIDQKLDTSEDQSEAMERDREVLTS